MPLLVLLVIEINCFLLSTSKSQRSVEDNHMVKVDSCIRDASVIRHSSCKEKWTLFLWPSLPSLLWQWSLWFLSLCNKGCSARRSWRPPKDRKAVKRSTRVGHMGHHMRSVLSAADNRMAAMNAAVAISIMNYAGGSGWGVAGNIGRGCQCCCQTKRQFV